MAHATPEGADEGLSCYVKFRTIWSFFLGGLENPVPATIDMYDTVIQRREMRQKPANISLPENLAQKTGRFGGPIL